MAKENVGTVLSFEGENLAKVSVKFGKTDKIQKVAIRFDEEAGKFVEANIADNEAPTAILYAAKDGQWFIQDVNRYPEFIKAVLFWHGAKQKTGDEYANLDDIDDCLEAVRAMDDRLAEGKFYANRQGGEAGMGILLRALMELFSDKTKEEVREFLKGLDAKEKAALRLDPTVKPIIERLEGEKTKGTDSSALLGKLRGQS